MCQQPALRRPWALQHLLHVIRAGRVAELDGHLRRLLQGGGVQVRQILFGEEVEVEEFDRGQVALAVGRRPSRA